MCSERPVQLYAASLLLDGIRLEERPVSDRSLRQEQPDRASIRARYTLPKVEFENRSPELRVAEHLQDSPTRAEPAAARHPRIHCQPQLVLGPTAQDNSLPREPGIQGPASQGSIPEWSSQGTALV